MAEISEILCFTGNLIWCFIEIAFFWWLKLYYVLTTKSKKQVLLDTLENAHTFEEWDAAAYQVDDLLGNKAWRWNFPSRDYDYLLIRNRTRSITDALQGGDVYSLIHMLRSGLVRNLGNITAAKLYNRAYAGTREVIEDYVTQCAIAVQYVTACPTAGPKAPITDQQKLDLLHDSRQALGRTCLVLQGGSIFGLCHLGVIKALHLQGILPRIIAGTATGALMAALVGVHTERELLTFLSGDSIDLTAFATAEDPAAGTPAGAKANETFKALYNRVRRFLKYGYVLDVKVLEECVRTNVGDLTFDEAFKRTRCVLNITITSTSGAVPSLLNYLTAPHVLIWSAALASNATDALKSPITLQCKTKDGKIEPWVIPAPPSKPKFQKKKSPSTDHDRHTPLSRAAELFNVNHFIVSQARPYIVPFLAPSLHHSSSTRSSREPWTTFFMRLLIMEIQHRLTQLDQLGLLSPGLRRLLIDEAVPGSSWTLVPKVSFSDFARLLRTPTQEEIDYWILRGERSVWPAVTALKIRCIVEVEIDRGYQLVRRRKPFDFDPYRDQQPVLPSEKTMRKKARAASLGGG